MSKQTNFPAECKFCGAMPKVYTFIKNEPEFYRAYECNTLYAESTGWNQVNPCIRAELDQIKERIKKLEEK